MKFVGVLQIGYQSNFGFDIKIFFSLKATAQEKLYQQLNKKNVYHNI